MDKRQTSVEWLVEKLPTIDKYDPYYADIIQQAKAMEKEQIIDAYINGSCDCEMLPMDSDAEQYYKESYGQ
jgi:hypothetical protein